MENKTPVTSDLTETQAKQMYKTTSKKKNALKKLLESELHTPVESQKKLELASYMSRLKSMNLDKSSDVDDCVDFLAENPRPTLIHMLAVCYLLSNRELSIVDNLVSEESINFTSLLQELEKTASS